MKKLIFHGIALVLGLMLFTHITQAQITIYTASLSGAAESPPNASPGTGSATVTVNSTLNTMRVQCTFSGLTGTTTATHIHATTAMANTGTAGVATQTPTFTGFPSGVTSGTYDQTFDMTLASSYNATFVTANGGTPATAFAALKAALDANKAYFNIHTNIFPGGEIRGFLTPCSLSNIAYVNTTVASSGDGTTWATAFKTLQEALAFTNSCPNVTQIWVAKGTYYPTADETGNLAPADPRTKTLVMKNNIAIYGGFVGNEASNYDLSLRNFTTNETILSGDIDQNNTLDNNNAYNVLVNINTNNTAILDGFTVTGGYANTDNGYPDRQARGAAIYTNTSSPTIHNCIFSKNFSVYGISYNVVSNATFTNCVFVQNQSNAFWNEAGGTTSLTNCTLSANASIIYTGSGTNTLAKNSIIWGNSGGIGGPSSSTITNSIVQGGYAGAGNLNQDPLFINQPTYGSGATGDLRLKVCSPAINAGTNTGAPAKDLDGNPRPYVGTVSITDMGAYEFQGNPIVINAPTITQPTCVLPTGTIVVNATGSGALEYSVNNGANWQTSATFSGLAAGNYTIKVRTQGSPSCEVSYGSNPVVLNSPFSMTAIDTWTGCVSTDWATAGNWQDGSVPTTTDNVNIPNVANDPIIGAGTAAMAKSVLVLGGAVLTINATGSLDINGSISPRHGLDNYGTLDNSGTIRVGNTTALGAIGIVQRNGGTFNNKTGSAIYIDQTGSGQAFYTSGIVNNDATIEIGSNAAVTGQGLYIEAPTGTFNNKTNSLLTINRSTTHGLENKGTLDNSGTIRIGNITSVGNRGIVHRNGGTLNNKTGGLIQIDRTSVAEAFYTSGVVNNEATIEIGSNATVTGLGVAIDATGTFNNKTGSLLTINRSTQWGMENKGTLDNSGTIRVGNIASVGAICIVHRNGGTFTNKTGGAIYMDRTTAGGQAFYSSGLVNNESLIKIGSNAAVGEEGIRIEGNVFNNKLGGSIQIDQTGSHAILLRNSGTIFNNESLIEIGSQSDVKGIGIRNGIGSGCIFNNKSGGDIRINRVGILNTNVFGAIRNEGTFTNDAKITVGNSVLLYAQDGILNISGSNFTNSTTGIISIAKPWGNGIWNSGGTFQNAGKITISDIFNHYNGGYSTGILSYASFTNTAGAEIHLNQVGNGITSTNAFTNAGLIRMGEASALTGSGIVNLQGAAAVFNNNAGGDISIKQTAVAGVQNGKNDDGSPTFNNNACAKLTIFDNLENYGTFTNAGLFTVNTAQAHTNTGTLTNNGIIEYSQGNPIPNVINNDVIANPIAVCSAGTISPALQIGGMNSFNISSTWYKELTLTNEAGTYSPNTFTVTNLAASSTYPLYFEITDPVNMCTRKAEINVTVNPLPTASISGMTAVCQNTTSPTITFTGGGGTAPYTFTYKINNGPDLTVVSTGNTATVSVPTSVSGIFTYSLVSVKDASSTQCSQTQNGTATITVNPLPTASISATPTAVCQNAPFPTITLTGNGGTAPYTFTYQINGATPQTTTSSGNSVSISQSTAVASTYTYTLVSIKDAKGCQQLQTGSASITVHAPPMVSSPQNTLCTGLTMILTPNSGGTWQSSNPSLASVTIDGLVTAIAPGVVFFTFTQSSTGCSSTTANVTIKQTPSSNLEASKYDVCPNTEVTLTPNCSVPTSTLSWNPGAPTVTPDAATVPYVYRVRCIADGCEGNESQVEVRTHRILVDMKDLDVGALPLPIVRAARDNMAPTNQITAPVFPRRWTFIANGCNASESAEFKLSGPVNFNTIDNASTYAMFANDGGGFYSIDHPNYGNGGSFPNGTYSLTINLRNQDGVGGPFPKNRVPVGALLATRTLEFTVGSPLGGRQGVEALVVESENWVSIGQNPVNDEIIIKLLGGVGEEVALALVNLQGQTIQQKSLKLSSPQQQEVMNVRNTATGLYLLKVIKDDKVKTFKIVKVE